MHCSPRMLIGLLLALASPLASLASCGRTVRDTHEGPDAAHDAPESSDAIGPDAAIDVSESDTSDDHAEYGTCPAGLADCDGFPGNQCETHLTDDAKNCGTCGHDCLGGECDGGACQPVALAVVPGCAESIQVVNDHVYWLTQMNFNYPRIGRTPSDGGPTEIVVQPKDSTRAFVVAGDSLFWTEFGGKQTVNRLSLLGGSPLVIDAVANAQETFQFAVSAEASELFWPTVGAQTLRRVDLASSTASDLLTTESQVSMLAMDAQYLYYFDAQTLKRVAKSGGGPPVVLSTLPSTLGAADRSFAIDGTHAYWRAGWSVIARAPLSGGAAEPLVTELISPGRSVAPDPDGQLYFVDGVPPAIQRVQKSGSARVTLAVRDDFVHVLATDANRVFWLELTTSFPKCAESTLFSLAK